MEDMPAEIVKRTPDAPVQIRAFLIADIRGYTAFTRERGDEAAAELASTFAGITRGAVASHAGEVIELRGDEALAVFSSTRQSLRAAVDLQIRYLSQSQKGSVPLLPVGIGVDAGEAIPVEKGFRGAALNMAARLCSAAGPGEILATQAVSHLAGTIEGLEYTERKLRNIKGMTEPVRAVEVSSAELRELQPSLPAKQKRLGPRDEDELGAQISSMVQEHLGAVNEQLAGHLSSLKQMPQMQPAVRFERAPSATPSLPASVPTSKRRLTFHLLPLVVLLAILVVLALLWLYFH